MPENKLNKVFIRTKSNNNMKKTLLTIIMLAFLLVIPMINAEQDSLGTFKQNENIELLQICGTCTYNNITSIVLPNSTHLIIDAVMNRRGAEYNYTFSQTDLLGTYSVNGVGDLDGTANAWAYELTVTPTGSERPSESEGTLITISIVVMLLVSLFFFVLGMKTTSGIGSLCFIAISGIMLFVAFMFTLTIVSDNLSHLGSAMQGYTTFLMIVKAIVSIAVTTLVLYALYKAYTIWGLKRGLRFE